MDIYIAYSICKKPTLGNAGKVELQKQKMLMPWNHPVQDHENWGVDTSNVL